MWHQFPLALWYLQSSNTILSQVWEIQPTSATSFVSGREEFIATSVLTLSHFNPSLSQQVTCSSRVGIETIMKQLCAEQVCPDSVSNYTNLPRGEARRAEEVSAGLYPDVLVILSAYLAHLKRIEWVTRYPIGTAFSICHEMSHQPISTFWSAVVV